MKEGEEESERGSEHVIQRERESKAFYNHLITPLHEAVGHTEESKSPFLEAVALMYSLGVQLRHTIPEPMEYNCPEKKNQTLWRY